MGTGKRSGGGRERKVGARKGRRKKEEGMLEAGQINNRGYDYLDAHSQMHIFLVY